MNHTEHIPPTTLTIKSTHEYRAGHTLTSTSHVLAGLPAAAALSALPWSVGQQRQHRARQLPVPGVQGGVQVAARAEAPPAAAHGARRARAVPALPTPLLAPRQHAAALEEETPRGGGGGGGRVVWIGMLD